MSLRVRIALIASLAVVVSILIASVSVYVTVRSNVRGEVESTLEDRGGIDDVVRELQGGRGTPEDVFRRRPGASSEERFEGAVGYVQYVDPRGVGVGPLGARPLLPVDEDAREIATSGAGRDVDDVTVDGVHVLVLTRGVGRFGAIQVARPLTEADRVLDRVLVVLILVMIAGAALAGALGAFVAKVALAPIQRFTERIEDMAADRRISERIEIEGEDEIARLSHSFNATLDELEEAVASQRRLMADASHELRTPIASLRANIQTLEHADRFPPAEAAALRADVLTELDELTALVGDVVELAREKAADEALDDVRLDELVTVAVERASRRGDKHVHFEVDAVPTLVRGEPSRMARAIANLLANARTWSPEGATVEVTLHHGMLIVRDHGPGFAEEDLPHVFERFYRAAAARGTSGSGLGLAIVRQAAEAYGGSAEAVNAYTGGAELRVRFGEEIALDTARSGDAVGDSSSALSGEGQAEVNAGTEERA